MDIRVLDDNPLYQNQIYRLKFTFSQKYPIGIPLPFPPSYLPAQIQTGVYTKRNANSWMMVAQNPPKSNLSSSPRPPKPPAQSPSTHTSTAMG